MKRIVHLITSLEGGGTENFLYQILAHSPAGYDHQVLYLKKDGVIGERLRRRQITVRPAGTLLRLFKTLRKESPHLLHTCLYSAHQVGRCLGRLARVPTVITSQRSIDIWQKPWQRLLDRWTLPLCHAVIVNSNAAARVIEQRRNGRPRPAVFEIPNGVDNTLFKPIDRNTARSRYGLSSDAMVGGSLMRLHGEKGADFIPEYASRLLAEFPKLHLLIGGVGPLEKSIKEQIDKTTYSGRIHFVGWVDDAPEFLSACDFFWSLSREESFPQTLVEASTMGLPWVAPETGGVPELLQAGAVGRVFQRLDIPGAARQVALLINELTSLKTEANRAVPKIQANYSLSKMVARVYEVFERF